MRDVVSPASVFRCASTKRCARGKVWKAGGRSVVSSYALLEVPKGSALIVTWPEIPVWPQQSAQHAQVVVEIGHTEAPPPYLIPVTAALEGTSRALWDRFARVEATPFWAWLRRLWAALLLEPPDASASIPDVDLEWLARLSRTAADVGDPRVSSAIRGEITAELDAIDAALLGRFEGRSSQARQAERPVVEPRQVAVGLEVYHEEALRLSSTRDLGHLEPASASAVVANWLTAAVQLWADTAGRDALEAVDVAPMTLPSFRPIVRRVIESSLMADRTINEVVEHEARAVGAIRLFTSLDDAYVGVRQLVVALVRADDRGVLSIGSTAARDGPTRAGSPEQLVARRLSSMVRLQ